MKTHDKKNNKKFQEFLVKWNNKHLMTTHKNVKRIDEEKWVVYNVCEQQIYVYIWDTIIKCS